MSKEKSNKIYGLIKTIVFYIVVAFISLFLVFEIFIPKQTIKIFGFKPYNVLTTSMVPVLNVNDLIIDKNFKLEDLQENDIITFYADIDYNGEKEIVTHYIYSINKDSSGNYIIRTNRYHEDGQLANVDPWILSADDVLGLYSFKIPLLGAVSNFLRSPFGIATIIVNAGIITTIVILIKREKKSKAAIEEKKDS